MFLGKSASKSLITPSIDMLVVAPGDHGKAMARSIKIAAIAAVSVCGSAAIAANFNLAVARSLYIYIFFYFSHVFNFRFFKICLFVLLAVARSLMHAPVYCMGPFSVGLLKCLFGVLSAISGFLI